jgi:hypothetical protein
LPLLDFENLIFVEKKSFRTLKLFDDECFVLATEGSIYSSLELIKDSGCSWFYLHVGLAVYVSCKKRLLLLQNRAELVSDRGWESASDQVHASRQ